MARARWCVGVLLVLLAATGPALAQEPFRFPEGKHGKGELKTINGLPVLFLEGKPEEIGAQLGALGIKPGGQKLLGYPKDYMKRAGQEAAWPAVLLIGKGLVANFPEAYRQEMEAAGKAAGINPDLLIAANTLFDIKMLAGCSSLTVDGGRSATGGPLFGRNLDFSTLGYLQDYSIVIVCKPEGKRPFVSVGFPGVLGCLSGINDSGLSIAVLESYASCDNSPKFTPGGLTYALCFRRVLEECATVDEAEKLLRSLQRTIRMNLAVCDKNKSAVFEMTPKTFAVRAPENGVCPCTNHFRVKELAAAGLDCPRYKELAKAADLKRATVADLGKLLDGVHQGPLTLQTMVFEPAALKLHVALGRCPTTKLPMQTLDVAELLKARK